MFSKEHTGSNSPIEKLDLVSKRNILTNMIRAKTNYMSDLVYSRELYLCDCGDGLLCSTQHYKVCRKYEKFRMNIDWTDNNQVIRYYQKILKLRENEEKTSPSTQT